MARRSLQLHHSCLNTAKAALKNGRYKTQIRLAIEAGIQAQATVSHFFCGKPIERANFVKFCQLLNLDPVEVGEEPPRQMRAVRLRQAPSIEHPSLPSGNHPNDRVDERACSSSAHGTALRGSCSTQQRCDGVPTTARTEVTGAWNRRSRSRRR